MGQGSDLVQVLWRLKMAATTRWHWRLGPMVQLGAMTRWRWRLGPMVQLGTLEGNTDRGPGALRKA